MRRRTRILGAVAAIVVLFFAYRPVRDWMRGYFEVTSYSVGKMPDGTWTLPLNRSVYRVYPNEGRAIYWLPGVIESPTDLVECVVRDRCNWSCSFPDHSGAVRMDRCMEESLDPSRMRPVSAATWWKLHYD